MAPHSCTLAWKIPWTEEPGRLQSLGSLRVRHDWATSLSLSCIGKGNGNPLQCSCLENPRDGGAWQAALYGVAQSWTQLKRFSSSSLDIIWRRAWQPTPVFLLGESHGLRSLVGYSPRGCKESDRTEWPSFTFTFCWWVGKGLQPVSCVTWGIPTLVPTGYSVGLVLGTN